MTCREFVDFLMAYLEGELPASQRDAFDAHMRVCVSCVHYLEGYRETVRLGRAVCAADDDSPPEDVPDELVEAILAARRAR